MKDVVYHGSPDGNIKVLTPHKSTHQKSCIYATDNKVVALLFMGKGNGDLDVQISRVDDKLELVERREGILNKLYNKEGYLYELDGETFSHYDYLWSLEVISFEKKIVPIKKIYYSNILEALEKFEKEDKINIYRYPDRPRNIPLDNSDLIEKYISFEERGLTGAVADLLNIYPEFSDRVNEILKAKEKH